MTSPHSSSDSTIDSQTFTRNAVFNLLDGAFFGLGIGITSFVTVLPLFVSQLTDSAILIGLIPAIRSMGWLLPQLLTANYVSQLSLYKPLMLRMAINERLPYFGLALIAWFLPQFDKSVALLLTYALLIWNALGGGLAATPWQSLIAKLIPGNRLGLFFGAQAGIANLCLSVGALLSGMFLERIGAPASYALCFLLTAICLIASWLSVMHVWEPHIVPTQKPLAQRDFWKQLGGILRRDKNFGWFIVSRVWSQLATMAFGFYTVYALKHFNMSAGVAGQMTAIFAGAQIIANFALGWLGDRWGHRLVMALGGLIAAASALLAWLANDLVWFYLVFVLAGVAIVAIWTNTLAFTLEFGSLAERPAYIGLANSLTAPATILAPLLGGWLADTVGYSFTFMASALGGLIMALVMMILLRDPQKTRA